MDCTDIKAHLSSILDGQLDPETRHEAERHIASCAACRRFISKAEAVDAMISADVDAASVAMMASITGDFEEAVLSRTVWAPPIPIARGRQRLVAWSGWMAAAACIGLATMIWVLDQRGARINSPPSQPAAFDGMQLASLDSGVRRSWTYESPLPREAFAVHEVDPEDQLVELPPGGAVSPQTAIKLLTEPEAQDELSISSADAQALYTASLLLQTLGDANVSSFADVEWIRRVAEYDGLLDRLQAARSRLPKDQQPALLAAEGVLFRAVRGPVSVDDVRDLSQTVNDLNLADQLERLSDTAVSPTT